AGPGFASPRSCGVFHEQTLTAVHRLQRLRRDALPAGEPKPSALRRSLGKPVCLVNENYGRTMISTAGHQPKVSRTLNIGVAERWLTLLFAPCNTVGAEHARATLCGAIFRVQDSVDTMLTRIRVAPAVVVNTRACSLGRATSEAGSPRVPPARSNITTCLTPDFTVTPNGRAVKATSSV